MRTELTCTMHRNTLIKILTGHLTQHRVEYFDAMDAWRKVMKNAAHSILGRGDDLMKFPEDLQKAMKLPTSHEEEIQEIIDMLRRSSTTQLTLSHDDYKKLVSGQWYWKDEFTTSNSFYREWSRKL